MPAHTNISANKILFLFNGVRIPTFFKKNMSSVCDVKASNNVTVTGSMNIG